MTSIIPRIKWSQEICPKSIWFVFVLLIFCSVFASGCAPLPTYAWSKQGASEQELHSANYECLRQAQQPYRQSGALNTGGIVSPSSMTTASSSSGYQTNEQLFNACMQAKGWRLQQQSGMIVPPVPGFSKTRYSKRENCVAYSSMNATPAMEAERKRFFERCMASNMYSD